MRRALVSGLIATFTLSAQQQPEPGKGAIAGHVFNSLTGEPVRKAIVVLDAAQFQLIDNTDATGRFQFSGLPDGTYRLSAKHAGFLDHSARRRISMVSGEAVTGAEIRIPPQGVISGKILDEDDDPMPGAMIWPFKQVYREGRKKWETVRSNTSIIANERGEYRVANLAPGRYILRAIPLKQQLEPRHNRYGEKPKTYYFPTYYPKGSVQESAVPIELGIGTQVPDIDIHLLKVAVASRASFHVSGTVVDAPPGSVISVSMFDQNDGSDCDGSTTAEPPDYRFLLETHGGQCTLLANVYDDRMEAFAHESLTVTGDVAGVIVTMEPGAKLTGKIRLPEGSVQTLDGIRFFVHGLTLDDRDDARLSDSAGNITFAKSLRPGFHYSISVRPQSIPDCCFVQEVRLDGQEISPADFELHASAQLDVVLSDTAAKIAGSVTDADDKPVPDSKVTLIPADEKSEPMSQIADDSGTFHFGSLRPGVYDLFAWEEVDDDLWQDPDFRKKYDAHLTKVTVAPSETQNVVVRVIPFEGMK